MESSKIIFIGKIVDLHTANTGVNDDFDDLKTSAKLILDSLGMKYGGELLSSNSEDISMEFKYPENAVSFAIRAFNSLSQNSRFTLKSGICSGIDEPSYNKADSNTIAHKLSKISPDGSILVTKYIFSSLQNFKEFKLCHIGELFLKETGFPVDVYALSDHGLYVPSLDELTHKSKKKNSIAVLPFHNTSSEKELNYICDGIAEEVIDSLTKSKELFVTARSSSFVFKNKEVSILDISRKLNVSYVLDGSIRKRQDNYRISYQLVDCSTGYNVISDTLDATFDDLYDNEIEISRAVVKYFNPNLPEENSENEGFYLDPKAYSYYLKGKQLVTHWELSKVKEAVKLFEKALEISPDYALAYAGLSVAYAHMGINKFADFRDSISKAIKFADKSIAADNTIPDGYISKAISAFWMGNWFVPDFETNITNALAISPCNAEIRMFNGMLFLIKGELKRSLSELLLAKQLDPYSQSVNIRLGLVQYLNREYEDAFNTFLYLLKYDYNRTYNIIRVVWCCIQLKQYHKALEFLDKADTDYEYSNLIFSTYLVIYAALKDDVKFYEYKDIIEQQPKDETCTNYNHAVLYKLLGQNEEAIEYLEKTLDDPLFLFTFMQYDEFWEEYHEHPRFMKLIASKYRGKGNQFIKIESETKEFVEIKISDFLYAEAQDNYTLIVYKDKNNRIEKILRATLSHVEDQLRLQNIIRCHRSYIFNPGAGFKYHKTGNRAHLKLPERDIVIPVSRSNEKEVKAKISEV